jgi:hypothetical protein
VKRHNIGWHGKDHLPVANNIGDEKFHIQFKCRLIFELDNKKLPSFFS